MHLQDIIFPSEIFPNIPSYFEYVLLFENFHILQRNWLTKKTTTLQLVTICWLPFKVLNSKNWKQNSGSELASEPDHKHYQITTFHDNCNITANGKLLGKHLNFTQTQYSLHQDRVGCDCSVDPESRSLFATYNLNGGNTEKETHWAKKSLSLLFIPGHTYLVM